jgi:hypothetical protein
MMDHLRIGFPMRNIVDGNDRFEMVTNVPSLEDGLDSRSPRIGDHRHLEATLFERLEGLRKEGIVSDRLHPLDNASPHSFLEARPILNPMVSNNLIGTTVEAIVDELLGIRMYPVLSHDRAKGVSPRWEGRSHGTVEIEEESSMWGGGCGEVGGRHGEDTITHTDLR